MSRIARTAVIMPLALALAGCGSPNEYQSDPVRLEWMQSVFDAGPRSAAGLGGIGPGAESLAQQGGDQSSGSVGFNHATVSGMSIRCWSDAPLDFTLLLKDLGDELARVEVTSECDPDQTLEVAPESPVRVNELQVLGPDYSRDPDAAYVILLRTD